MSSPLGAGNRGAKRLQLPEEVATYVRELIISGAVRPGEFLRMEPIAEAVGVSNTPVREGLLNLRSEGFVQLVPRRGFVVAPFTKQDIMDLFWAQAQLGSELAARAAKRVTNAQIDVMDKMVHQLDEAAKAGDKERVADLGHAFHREVNLAADSHRLALLLGSVVRQLPNRFYATIEGQVTATRDDHPHIAEALRKHDARKARSLMSSHILEGAERLISSLEERGLWAEEESAS
jgi:DNA-binding GntR family transcriptional regulator